MPGNKEKEEELLPGDQEKGQELCAYLSGSSCSYPHSGVETDSPGQRTGKYLCDWD